MLVIVLPVGRVPVAVVDVVDVVAVLNGPVSAVLAVDVRVRLRRSPRRPARPLGNGARIRCRRRSSTPTGQARTKQARASSTIVGPAATSRGTTRTPR